MKFTRKCCVGGSPASYIPVSDTLEGQFYFAFMAHFIAVYGGMLGYAGTFAYFVYGSEGFGLLAEFYGGLGQVKVYFGKPEHEEVGV